MEQIPHSNQRLDSTPLLDFARADLAYSRRMRIAVCIALYLMLIGLWIPGFEENPSALYASPPTRVERSYVIKPKALEPETKVVKKKALNRTMPMPDQTLLEPEPLIEAAEPDDFQVVYAGDEWVASVPDTLPQVEERLYEHTAGVSAPVITRRVMALYPERALKLRMQGYVIVQAVLMADGSVGDVTVLRGLGSNRFGFEDAAINAVRQWEFIPGTFRGKPANITLSLKVTFNLQ